MATTADGSASQVNGLRKMSSPNTDDKMEGGLMVNSFIEHGGLSQVQKGKQPDRNDRPIDHNLGNPDLVVPGASVSPQQQANSHFQNNNEFPEGEYEMEVIPSDRERRQSVPFHQTPFNQPAVRQVEHTQSFPLDQPSSPHRIPRSAISAGFLGESNQQQEHDDQVNGIEVVKPISRRHRTQKRVAAIIPLDKRWRWTVGIVLVALFAVIVALAAVLGVQVKKNRQPSSPTSTGTRPSSTGNPPGPTNPPVQGYPQAQVLPSTNVIAATDIIVGTLFSPESAKPQIRVLYESNGKLCIKTKLGSSFIPQVRCIENANAKDATPLTICDWLGGPTVIYITKDNHLAGFDYVPANDSWSPSLITTNTVPVHLSSRLSSVTWLNGTSMWIYYQGQDSQLREWGIDDYRNKAFRDGSAGPLATIQNGSSIGVVRYGATGADETEEVCFQVTNGALHCRRYANSVWGDEQYTIAGTESGLALQASFDLTMVPDTTSGNITIAVAYLKTNGYIGLQTRPVIKGADPKTLGTFSKGTQVALGDGDASAGLVINGESGTVNVYLKKTPVNGGHIFQYSSDAKMVTWSNGTDITLS